MSTTPLLVTFGASASPARNMSSLLISFLQTDLSDAAAGRSSCMCRRRAAVDGGRGAQRCSRCATALHLLSWEPLCVDAEFPQRLDFLRHTFDDLERDKQLRHKQSLKSMKALDELGAERNNLRRRLQELEAKRELQEQLFDKFMVTTSMQLELQLAEIESLECLAAASSSELVIRSLEVVEPIKGSLAQSMAQLIYEMCAHYSSFTRDSTQNVYVFPLFA